MARTGRRSGDQDTRETILDAARTAFAESGYRATIRQIASAADVDPALVLHYFGNKDALYAASIRMPVEPSALRAAISAGRRDEVGTRLATFFFAVWENSELREPFLAILRGAISGHDPGLVAFRGFISSTMVPIVADQIDGDQPRLKAELAVAQLVGIAVLRYVVELEPIASTPLDDVVGIVAPRIQTYFD